MAAVEVLRFETFHLAVFNVNYNYASTYSFVTK